MKYWLIKSEGDCYSIGDLKRDKRTAWTGIRNFTARNFMRDGMKKGDLILFYHSNGTPAAPTGVYGVAKVMSAAHIDETALDPKDEHYDPTAAKYAQEGKEPMWMCVDVGFVAAFAHPVLLEAMKRDSKLAAMLVLQRGQRLSVMPVAGHHFRRVLELST
ncbi:MAG: RNA-binding protein [Candidatus Parcubacteria bacterium]|nr:RNA-binding protein [Candidatus Parcubacteria bacterium]